MRVGYRDRFGLYTNAQGSAAGLSSAGLGTSGVRPHRQVTIKLVGIGVFNNGLVQDDVDRFPAFVALTPALTRPLLQCCAAGLFGGIRLDRGSRDVVAVEAEIGRVASS